VAYGRSCHLYAAPCVVAQPRRPERDGSCLATRVSIVDRSAGRVRWWRVVEALPRQSFTQLKEGAGRGLSGQFGAALGGDVFDGGEAMSILVRSEQTFQRIGVRIGAHDRIVVQPGELPG
jgi:hypothetical protein